MKKTECVCVCVCVCVLQSTYNLRSSSLDEKMPSALFCSSDRGGPDKTNQTGKWLAPRGAPCGEAQPEMTRKELGFGFLPPSGWTPAVGWPGHWSFSESHRQSRSSQLRAARPWWWTCLSPLSSPPAALVLLSLTGPRRPDLQSRTSFKFIDRLHVLSCTEIQLFLHPLNPLLMINFDPSNSGLQRHGKYSSIYLTG